MESEQRDHACNMAQALARRVGHLESEKERLQVRAYQMSLAGACKEKEAGASERQQQRANVRQNSQLLPCERASDRVRTHVRERECGRQQENAGKREGGSECIATYTQGTVEGFLLSERTITVSNQATLVNDPTDPLSVDPIVPAEIDIASNTSGGRCRLRMFFASLRCRCFSPYVHTHELEF